MTTKTIRILCFGDSNTWGYNPVDGSRFPSHVRWTGVLQELLGQKFVVIEEGLNGRTTNFDYSDRLGKNGLNYLIPCLDSHFPVDVAIICLGTNDAKTEFALTPLKIAEGLEACLKVLSGEKVERPSLGMKKIVMSPALVDERYINYDPLIGSEEKTKQFSKLFQELAQKYEAEFVDLSVNISPSKADGCHLDPNEHKKIAEILVALIRKMTIQN